MQSIQHHKSLNIVTNSYTYKIGMNEVQGLEASILKCLEPLKTVLKSKMYWIDNVTFERAEYESRSGFIPHAHNKGGLQFNAQIPECESSNFSAIEFGEMTDDDYEGCETEEQRDERRESYSSEGHLDAYLSIWFKFEGFDSNGDMMFYLVASGGNEDAPYFRTIPTLFEVEFKCKTLKQLERVGQQKVKSMIKKILK